MARALALIAVTQPTFGTQQTVEADEVYIDGFVYTVDAVRSRAHAFAVKVDNNNDMKAVPGKNTKNAIYAVILDT